MSKITNIPDLIYLQVDPDEWITDDESPTKINFHELATKHEVTWCEDNVNTSDVAYLKATPKRLLVDELTDALVNLLLACWQADAQADLSHEVDGSLMDAARIVLDKIPGYIWRPQ